MSSWACVSGRRTPRPPSRHVVHAWIPGSSRRSRAAPSGAPPVISSVRASAIDRPSRAPASHCAQQCRTHAAIPSAVPPAKPGGRCPVLPLPAQVPDLRHREALAGPVRSPPPPAEPPPGPPRRRPNRTGPGSAARRGRPRRPPARGPPYRPVTRSASSARRAATWPSGRGRPRSGSAARSAAASTCSRASACSGRGAPDPQQAALLLRDAHGTGQYRTGHGVVRAGPSGAPSRAADARAARRLASAAVAGHPRRFTGWLCSSTSASRARSTAAATPGSATIGASGSVGNVTPLGSQGSANLPGRTVRIRAFAHYGHPLDTARPGDVAEASGAP